MAVPGEGAWPVNMEQDEEQGLGGLSLSHNVTMCLVRLNDNAWCGCKGIASDTFLDTVTHNHPTLLCGNPIKSGT